VAQVGEESQRSGQAFGHDRILGAASLEFNDVHDLAVRGQKPAERIGQGEADPLAVGPEEPGPVGILGLLQVLQRPQPELHGRGQRTGPSARLSGGKLA